MLLFIIITIIFVLFAVTTLKKGPNGWRYKRGPWVILQEVISVQTLCNKNSNKLNNKLSLCLASTLYTMKEEKYP